MDAQRPAVPYGFEDAEEFQEFAGRLRRGLPEGTQPLFQGSSVTGTSWRSGRPFDEGRQSDYDIALAGPGLYGRAQALRLKAKDGTRIGPLSDAQLDALGLLTLRDELSQLAGRPVKFMLFASLESAFKRPWIWVP
jgi:hypothetical protein